MIIGSVNVAPDTLDSVKLQQVVIRHVPTLSLSPAQHKQITGAAPTEHSPAPAVEETGLNTSTQEAGDGIGTSPENVEAGPAGGPTQGQVVEGVEDQVRRVGSYSA